MTACYNKWRGQRDEKTNTEQETVAEEQEYNHDDSEFGWWLGDTSYHPAPTTTL